MTSERSCFPPVCPPGPFSFPAPLPAPLPQELLCALERNVTLDLLLSPPQEAAFLAALSADFSFVRERLQRVDARASRATLPGDRAAVLAAVQAGCGLQALDRAVAERLGVWVGAAADKAPARVRGRATFRCLRHVRALIASAGARGGGGRDALRTSAPLPAS